MKDANIISHKVMVTCEWGDWGVSSSADFHGHTGTVGPTERSVEKGWATRRRRRRNHKKQRGPTIYCTRRHVSAGTADKLRVRLASSGIFDMWPHVHFASPIPGPIHWILDFVYLFFFFIPPPPPPLILLATLSTNKNPNPLFNKL